MAGRQADTRLRAGVAVAGVLLAVAAGGGAAAEEPGRLPADRSVFPGGRPFAPSSPFNTRIPPRPRLHPDSKRVVAALARRATGGIVVATREWTMPVFLADRSKRRHEVRLTAEWSPFERMVGMPIPDVARPDPQGDGHLAVVDRAGGWVWELWQARRTGRGWQASWGNRIALASSGVYPYGMSARGSGFSVLAGLIWPHELRRGRIQHALAFSTYPNRAGVLVRPATESDGDSSDPLALPEGARLQLDPGLDLDRLGLAPWERTIARAMQEYGLVLVDNGGASIALYHAHPASFGRLRLPFPTDDGAGVIGRKIPLRYLRVLDWGREIPLAGLRLEVADRSIYRGPRAVSG